jgi:hypothetical protein
MTLRERRDMGILPHKRLEVTHLARLSTENLIL